MKKKIVMMLCAAMLMGAFSGCGMTGAIVVDENGKITETASTYYNEQEYEQQKEMYGSLFDEENYKKVEIDGRIFYQDISGESTGTTRGISKTEVYCPFGIETDEEKAQYEEQKSIFDFYTFTVTLPEPIVNTNGELSEDKKTVTFYPLEMIEKGEKAAYAYTENSKGALFIDSDKYVQGDKVELISDSVIQALTVNGKEKTPGNSVAMKKDGTYKISVSNETVSKSFKVIRDTKAPTIKGVKDGKTYKKPVTIKFSDKNKIVSATLNDKKLKTGKKIKKKGCYTVRVKDIAGNESSVSFWIE